MVGLGQALHTEVGERPLSKIRALQGKGSEQSPGPLQTKGSPSITRHKVPPSSNVPGRWAAPPSPAGSWAQPRWGRRRHLDPWPIGCTCI